MQSSARFGPAVRRRACKRADLFAVCSNLSFDRPSLKSCCSTNTNTKELWCPRILIVYKWIFLALFPRTRSHANMHVEKERKGLLARKLQIWQARSDSLLPPLVLHSSAAAMATCLVLPFIVISDRRQSRQFPLQNVVAPTCTSTAADTDLLQFQNRRSKIRKCYRLPNCSLFSLWTLETRNGFFNRFTDLTKKSETKLTASVRWNITAHKTSKIKPVFK